MRDAERLVQVEVRHIGARLRQSHESDEGVHVRPVHVDLPTRLVNGRADLAQTGLEDTVRGRVGEHDGSDPAWVGGEFGPHIIDVDIPGRRALHHDDLQPGHHGTRCIGAVSAAGHQADVPAHITARVVVTTDGQQPRELTL